MQKVEIKLIERLYSVCILSAAVDRCLTEKEYKRSIILERLLFYRKKPHLSGNKAKASN